MAASPKSLDSGLISTLIAPYGCGPVKFLRSDEALYERHLLFLSRPVMCDGPNALVGRGSAPGAVAQQFERRNDSSIAASIRTIGRAHSSLAFAPRIHINC